MFCYSDFSLNDTETSSGSDLSLNDTEQVLVHSPAAQVPQQQALRGPSNARTFTAAGIEPCHVCSVFCDNLRGVWS